MKKEIILIGGGGHAIACIDVIEQAGIFRISGIIDLPEKLHQKILGYEIIATDDDLSQLAKEYKYFFISIGQIRSPAKRIQMFDILNDLKVNMPTIISPRAYVSPHAKVGTGTIVMHHAIVNAAATIGKNCIINTKSLIEHDSKINDHCHISTGSIINGGVEIGVGSFVGSGAVCKELVKIGKRSVIGLNATIGKNLPDDSFIK